VKIGDLVKWIGFPGATIPPEKTGPTALGIIIAINKRKILMHTAERIDVAWGDGTIGRNLYPGTITVINKELGDKNENDRFTWD